VSFDVKFSPIFDHRILTRALFSGRYFLNIPTTTASTASLTHGAFAESALDPIVGPTTMR
jgi:hypothetical protein